MKTPAEKAAVYQAALEGKSIQHKPLPGVKPPISFNYWAAWHPGNGRDIPVDPVFYWDKFDYRVQQEPGFMEVALFIETQGESEYTQVATKYANWPTSWKRISDWVRIEKWNTGD